MREFSDELVTNYYTSNLRLPVNISPRVRNTGMAASLSPGNYKLTIVDGHGNSSTRYFKVVERGREEERERWRASKSFNF